MARSLSLMLMIATAALAGPAAGQRAPADDLTRLQAEHRDELIRARRLRAEAAEAADDIVRLDRELGALNARAADEDGRLATQRQRLRELNAREAALAGDQSGEQARLGRLLSALQMLSRRPPPPLLIPPERATDTVRAAILMKAAAPPLQRRARALADRQAEIGRVRRLAALSSEALFTAESEQLDRRGRIEQLSAQRASAQAVLRADAERAERAARALETRIRALGGEARPLSPAEATGAASPGLPGGRQSLGAPLAGSPRRQGAGLIWRGEAQAEVAAPAAGVVDYAGPLEGWGQVVILRLGPGWRVVLAGLDGVQVSEGATVGEGDPLGRLPDQPDPDLYLEVRREERAVEAGRWFD